MSSLVQANEQPRVRVGPRVFADVPTAQELTAVRKNRNSLAVTVVLLLGMLIASVVGLWWVSTEGSTGVEQANEELAQIREDIVRHQQERNDVLAALELDDVTIGQLDEAIGQQARETAEEIESLTEDRDELEEQLRDLTEYQTIHDRRLRAGRLQAEIEDLLDQPIRENAAEEIDLTVYDEGFPPWKEDLETRLRDYAGDLEGVRDEILEWRPRGENEPINIPDEPRLP